MQSISLREWDIPVSFYVRCPLVDKDIPLTECEACEHHKGFLQSSRPFCVVCNHLKQQTKEK